MKRYKLYFNEDITIPLNPGDKFYFGKFKNKSAIYDSHYINDKGDLIIRTDIGKEIPACKIRLMQEDKQEILLIKKTDLRDAYKFLSDYSELPDSVFLDSVKRGKYVTLKIKDLLAKSNTPWDNKRRPTASSRLNNTIILAHIKSSIGKSTPDYYLIVDGNHRVIQHIKLGLPTINCFIVECPYLFLNKRKSVSYDGETIMKRYKPLIQEAFDLEKFLKKWMIEGGINFPQIYIKYLINKYPQAKYKGEGIRILKNIKEMNMYSPIEDNFDININKLKNKIKKELYKYQSYSKTKEGIINVLERGLFDPYRDSGIGIKAFIEGIDLTKLTPYLKDKKLISFINDLEEVVAIAHSFIILGDLSDDKNNLFLPL